MALPSFSSDRDRFAGLSRRLEPLRRYELAPSKSRLGLAVQFLVACLIAAVLCAVAALPGALGAGSAAAAGISSFDQLPSNLAITPFAQNSTIYASS